MNEMINGIKDHSPNALKKDDLVPSAHEWADRIRKRSQRPLFVPTSMS